MNIESFVKLVQSMRAAQKAYFKDRYGDNLQLAKQLERAVDAEIEKANQKEHQATFFDH